MWPAYGLTMRLSAKNAGKVRRAFKDVLHGDEIARAWAETHPAGGSVSPQTARDWARVQISVSKKPMQNALARIYAEGYVTGEYAAEYMLARLKGLQKAPKVSAGVVDWATWTPGNRAAAALIKPKGGLKNLLNSRKITIANEVINTKLDRIGTALARGLELGWTPTQVTQTLNSIIDDPQHALVIAQTEMSRAVSVATRDSYETAGIEQVEWLVAEGCDECQENADASPIGIGDTFPSGDAEPPAHPNCMCSLAPYYDTDSTQADNSEIEASVEDFADEAQSFAEEIVNEGMPEPLAVEEKPEIDLRLNEPNIKNVTYTDELFNKVYAETGVSHLSLREINNLPQDVIAESISRIQGFNALPKVLNSAKFDDLVSKEGWIPIYRGVGGKTKAEVDGYVNEFKTASTQYGGRGIYGSGTYVAQNRSVAQHFSEANGAKNGEAHAFGRVMDMAIHPKAKIRDYDEIDQITKGQAEKLKRQTSAIWHKERNKAIKIIAKKEGLGIKKDAYGKTALDTDKFIVRKPDDGYGNERIDYDKSDFDSISRIEKELDALTKEFLAKTNYDKLAYLSDEALYANVGNRAALQGIDVIRVPKPEYSRDESGTLSDYYIVLNRGAIAVKE